MVDLSLKESSSQPMEVQNVTLYPSILFKIKFDVSLIFNFPLGCNELLCSMSICGIQISLQRRWCMECDGIYLVSDDVTITKAYTRITERYSSVSCSTIISVTLIYTV
jgi:hypothetical protein